MEKRLFDIVVSACGLLLLSPWFLLAGLLIKLTSQGPVFFRQERVGIGGNPFRIFKFRTMHQNIVGQGSLVTKKGDDRITSIGRWLRLTKLDELPQLINVLMGDMSLVGPRPEIPELVETYDNNLKRLLKVKPGITSPATIYHRDEEEIVGSDMDVLDYHKRVLIPRKAAFDLTYIDKASLTYDLKLILLTAVSVVTNQSGYMRERALKNRRAFILLFHCVISFLSYIIAYHARFDWHIPDVELIRMWRTAPVVILIQICSLSMYGLGSGYWRYVDIMDLFTLLRAVGFGALGLLCFEYLFFDMAYPTGIIFIQAGISLIFFTCFRLSTRFLREAYYSIQPETQSAILVYGVNDRSASFVQEIRANPESRHSVAGLIDNDPQKKGLRINRTKVLGTLTDLPDYLDTHSIVEIVNCDPDGDAKAIQDLVSVAAQYHIKLKTLPSMAEVLEGRGLTSFARSVEYEDLLGRDPVMLDENLLREKYTDKVVLITGAGGSIGSELAFQILSFAPKKLLLLDKDETLLYEVDLAIQHNQTKVPYETIIGDIQNRDRLERVFSEHQPDVVLHAAAYKHVPLMEHHPKEAYQNNVLGSYQLMTLAAQNKVERFVLVSTDKAVRSTNVMGATKRLVERILFECVAPHSDMKCMAVRFGNVLGSRGSVIPIFQKQIHAGGPISLTHRDITRYFMSVPEASRLVLQAGAMATESELYLLEMGKPVGIYDLACKLIELNGLIPNRDVDIAVTGLRPGEKLHEELLTASEKTSTTQHNKILGVDKKSEFNAELSKMLNYTLENAEDMTKGSVISTLRQWVPDYQAGELARSFEHE